MVEKLARKRKPNNVSVISNEVERYLEDVCEKIDGEDFELLSWWRGQKTRYPTLFRIAKDLFAIPCSTVASENAFSLGGRILDPFRASLSPKTVDWLVCSTDWMRGQEFNMYQEPTQEEQEWFKEFEDVEKGLKAFNRLGTTQDLDSDDDMDVEKNRLPSLSSC